MSALDNILHHQLGVHKRCARWVPHQLTDEQKGVRLEWCIKMLEKYDSGRSNSTWNVISDDENWVYQFDPESKAQSSVWLFPGQTPPQKFRRSRAIDSMDKVTLSEVWKSWFQRMARCIKTQGWYSDLRITSSCWESENHLKFSEIEDKQISA